MSTHPVPRFAPLPARRAILSIAVALAASSAALAATAGASPATAGTSPAAIAGEHGAPRSTPDANTVGAVASRPLPTPAELDSLAEESALRWEASPHGQMLVRILPQRLRPSELPDPQSDGARLTGLYCVQCHYLPSPAMHEAGNWERVVQRMLPRMRGEGNMGRLMAGMMVGPSGAGRSLAAPTPAEAGAIAAYLARNALKPLDERAPAALRRDLAGEDGRMFAEACSQCHALPDPASYTAADWPAVVQRMQRYMQSTNRVTGGRLDARAPQLQPATIIGFLQRHARPHASR